MKPINIYIIGVGGQGIGLLGEALIRAADHAGYRVKGVDTHGMAQRGGTVVSQIRLGKGAFSPLIPQGGADIVLALERSEALRAGEGQLREGGVLMYYDTEWPPLEVRLGKRAPVTPQEVSDMCARRGIREYRVQSPDLEDARMQNVVLLAAVVREGLIPGVAVEHVTTALADLLSGRVLELNLKLFLDESGGPGPVDRQ
jgi:indolepyruvate ferredoxin oxidoreductase beta subunit